MVNRSLRPAPGTTRPRHLFAGSEPRRTGTASGSMNFRASRASRCIRLAGRDRSGDSVMLSRRAGSATRARRTVWRLASLLLPGPEPHRTRGCSITRALRAREIGVCERGTQATANAVVVVRRATACRTTSAAGAAFFAVTMAVTATFVAVTSREARARNHSPHVARAAHACGARPPSATRRHVLARRRAP